MASRPASAVIASVFGLGLTGVTRLRPVMKGRDDYNDAYPDDRTT
jgi:hypothetical protein